MRLVLTTLLATLLIAAPASAQMQVGFQDDNDMQANPTATLIAWPGDRWVRFMVQETNPTQNETAIRTAKARGYKVMVSMFRWNGARALGAGMSDQDWSRFINTTTPRLAAYVDAYGVNEPNHPAFAMRPTTICVVNANSKNQETKVGRGYRKLIRFKRKRHGNYKRLVKYIRSVRLATYKHTRGGWKRSHMDATHKRLVRFKKVKRGKGQYRRVVRRTKLSPRVIVVSTRYEANVCQRQVMAIDYRRQHDALAKVVRAVDPSAAVIAGELSPGGGNTAFMQNVFNSKRGAVDADIIGIHPYTHASPAVNEADGAWRVTTIERTVARARAWRSQGRLTGSRVWATEYGYFWSVSRPHPTWLSEALTRMQNAGVEGTILYDFKHTKGPWDSALLNANGSDRPTMTNLRTWLG